MEPTNNILLRKGAFRDWKALEEIEKICFPEAEAASGKVLKERLLVFPEHFWILEAEGRAVGFVNGMVTDQKTITDDLFACSSLHKERRSLAVYIWSGCAPSIPKKGLRGHADEKNGEPGPPGGAKRAYFNMQKSPDSLFMKN